MWVRTSLHLIKGQITLNEWWLRNISCFRKDRNKIKELIAFDGQYGVPSTFFFGMNQGLGLSYKPDEAKQIIKFVYDNGFAVGVHGIDYQNTEGMKKEFETFRNLMGFSPCGIRMHYVRFDDSTFSKLALTGYNFDTTEFDKKIGGTVKDPYKVGDMWEFPLTIMDGYLPQKLKAAKQKTIEILDKCKEKNVRYITVLFHDYQFCDDYRDIREWYIWLIKYLSENPDYQFISYADAIRELGSLK
jgi:hypothetical protein